MWRVCGTCLQRQGGWSNGKEVGRKGREIIKPRIGVCLFVPSTHLVPTAHGHHLLLPKQRLIQRRQAWSFKDNNGVSRLKHQGSQDIGLAE
ncbi:hypothetical protein QQF64_032319 [Cirrhinus molitorella]|uniref:Uncharacterized protein n=1 Tax=Cirrhinus molitorella TaxID=172907 RepID=A0ABR3MZF6_9TELE